MAIFKCLVNGGIDDETRKVVTDGLTRIQTEHFGASAGSVTVEFTEVGEGRWYTGGKLSEASMVLGTVPPGTPQAVRETVMDDIAHFFADATSSDYHQVMVVAADTKD